MSSHVTAKTLKLLVSKTEDEYDYTYLDHFREKHWGRPGGASVTFDNAGDPRQILCIPTAFSTRVKHPTLVRATYLDLWSNLRQLYLDVPMQNEVVYDATVVWGHPGIGSLPRLVQHSQVPLTRLSRQERLALFPHGRCCRG